MGVFDVTQSVVNQSAGVKMCIRDRPYIQLCVCYDRLGQKKKAREYNEKAGKLRPDSPAYQYNKAYYEKLFGEDKELSQ